MWIGSKPNLSVAKRLLRHAAPALVHAAEAKMRGEVADTQIFAEAIAGLSEQTGGMLLDQIILGCTHFPLVEAELREAALALGLSRDLQFVDGSDGIARRIKTLTEGQPWPSNPEPGLFVTTGEEAALTPYRPALTQYGLTKIATL